MLDRKPVHPTHPTFKHWPRALSVTIYLIKTLALPPRLVLNSMQVSVTGSHQSGANKQARTKYLAGVTTRLLAALNIF